MGLTTLAEEISAYDGGDWDDKHRESVRITDERIEDGLQAPNAPPPGTPGMPAAPASVPMRAPKQAPAQDDPEENDESAAMRGLRRARAIRAMAA